MSKVYFDLDLGLVVKDNDEVVDLDRVEQAFCSRSDGTYGECWILETYLDFEGRGAFHKVMFHPVLNKRGYASTRTVPGSRLKRRS